VTQDSEQKVPRGVRLIFADYPNLELSWLSAFLYDLVLLHDRLVLVISHEYEKPDWLFRDNFFLRRIARSAIAPPDRIQVKLIRSASPMILELAFGVAVAAPSVALTFIKVLEKIRDWNEDGRQKRLTSKQMEMDLVERQFELIRLLRELDLPFDEDALARILAPEIRRLVTNPQMGLEAVLPEDDRES